MTDRPIVPREVVERVEVFVAKELRDAQRYDNRKPLDESGVWYLHELAAEIYALGFADGVLTAEVRARGVRERASAEAEADRA